MRDTVYNIDCILFGDTDTIVYFSPFHAIIPNNMFHYWNHEKENGSALNLQIPEPWLQGKFCWRQFNPEGRTLKTQQEEHT